MRGTSGRPGPCRIRISSWAMIVSIAFCISVLAAVLVYAQAPSETKTAGEAEQTVKCEEDVLLKEVLSALADPEYDALLASLQGGEKITQGMKGDHCKILQKMLVELGCDIDVDGSAGPGTFGALNQVRAVFGMKSTDKADAAVLAEMLPLLLLIRNEDGIYTGLLQSIYREDGEGNKGADHFLYMQGCAYYLAGRYYHALEAFRDSGYADFEERAAACAQPWPSDGELWHNSSLDRGDGEDREDGADMRLTFAVESMDESDARCFEVYTEDDTMAAVLFLTGSGTVSAMLPGGNYRIRLATGTAWYGPEDVFGRDGTYEYMSFREFDEDEYLTRLDPGYEWTITVNSAEGHPDAADVGSVETDWDSWTDR